MFFHIKIKINIKKGSFIENLDNKNALKNSKMMELISVEVAKTIRLMENQIDLKLKVRTPNKGEKDITYSILDFI